MKNRIIWLCVSLLLIVALLLPSCSKSNSTATTTATPTTTAVATTVNWWDKLGTPQYGGTATLRLNADIVNFDPYNFVANFSVMSGWMEKLQQDDWTLDPNVFDYKINFRPSQFVKGGLAESWEFPDSSTYLVHIRQGVHWQNIAPANGREFVADDVAYHFDRQYGLGMGFTKPDPNELSPDTWKYLTSVTVVDKYTVAFKWSIPNPEYIMETMQTMGWEQTIECPDAVKQWGDLNDWHHAIGTGPFILQDFSSGTSATLVRNPNYWGYDERYPKNQLPYIDTLKYLIIADDTTSLAALRTGKIDAIDGIGWQDAQSMQKTNPEILQFTIPLAQNVTVDMRNDVKPFNDIRVRQALQMAIDLPTITKTIYGGTCSSDPVSLTATEETGYCYPYKDWPQSLKDEYAYNPTGAKKLLADAGYPNGFTTNVVADSSGGLDLLQVVKSYFSQIGVNMDIQTQDTSNWVGYVWVNHKDTQMAMHALFGSLGQSYEPTHQFATFQTGSFTNTCMVSDPVFDAFYPQAVAATSADQLKQVVIDTNKYVAQQHFAISLPTPNLFGLSQPWFKGYNGQDDSISGGVAGPHFINFYLSRFWIDQKLKTSLGH